jgi:phospholipid/cholesterol/gamma-HCH transport system permease protein
VISTAVLRLHGYLAMLVFAITRVGRFRASQLRLQLHRQVLAWGIAALPVALSLAALAGAITVTQVNTLAGQDNESAQRLLFYGLFFELAPLFSALVIVARSSAAIASELLIMQLNSEFVALRRMGIPAADFLLLPRVWGLALALPTVTVLFQGVCMGSGWLAAALVQNQPILEVAGRFFEFSNPWLMVICLGKTGIMGLLVGVISCHHGSCLTRSTQAIAEAGIHAVGNSLVAVFLVDMAFVVAALSMT